MMCGAHAHDPLYLGRQRSDRPCHSHYEENPLSSEQTRLQITAKAICIRHDIPRVHSRGTQGIQTSQKGTFKKVDATGASKGLHLNFELGVRQDRPAVEFQACVVTAFGKRPSEEEEELAEDQHEVD